MQSPRAKSAPINTSGGAYRLHFPAAMLIGRCAWHMLYYGHPRWEGVTSWQGWNVRFTDGICPRCLERFREEHQVSLSRRAARDAPAFEPEQAAS